MSERDFTTTNMISVGGGASFDGVGDRPGLFRAVPMALARWTTRQWAAAALGTIGIGVVIGLSTVLIPNGWFGREIEAVPWNYPVWIVVSVLSGMLFATYVQPSGVVPVRAGSTTGIPSGRSTRGPVDTDAVSTGPADPAADGEPDRPAEALAGDPESRFGLVGAVLGWFAVGCPVCNKIALLALGYTGALRWFAPVQPFLAVAAIGLSAFALAFRLRGQIWCPAPSATVRPDR